MRIFVALSIVALSACGPGRRSDGDDPQAILQRYQEPIGEDVVIQLPEGNAFRLAVWKQNALDPANLLSALQMEKEARTQIAWLISRLEAVLRHVGNQGETRESIENQINYERSKLALVERHLPVAPLPPDAAAVVDSWKKAVVDHSDVTSAARMRDASVARIKWLEGRIEEHRKHHQDLVWDNYMEDRLLLQIEVSKLGHIDRRLRG